MRTEKRKYLRLPVRDDVIIAIQNGINRIGKVKDISQGGLSFEHVYDEDSNWVGLIKNILIWADDFNMAKIPCRIVYDIQIPLSPEYGLLTVQFITRRCGVEFVSLTDHQVSQLDFFLKTFAKESS